MLNADTQQSATNGVRDAGGISLGGCQPSPGYTPVDWEFSSPRPIPELAAKHGWQMSPGDKVRLFDINVPGPKRGGIFDRIAGGPAKRAKRSIRLIAKLQRGYANHHGHTLPEWAIYLMAEDRSEPIIRLVNAFIDCVQARGNGWEVRFAAKFGLIYAAMQIASDAGLLPWQRTLALKVASKCYRKARAAARSPDERVSDAATKLHRLVNDHTRVVDRPTDGKQSRSQTAVSLFVIKRMVA